MKARLIPNESSAHIPSSPLVWGRHRVGVAGDAVDRSPGRVFRHQGGRRRAALSMPRGSKPFSPARLPGFRRPAAACGSSRAASRIRPICWRRPRAATCCAASRRASCCRPRMRSTASSASSARSMPSSFPVAAPVLYLRRCGHRRHAVLSSWATSRAASIWEPHMPGVAAARARGGLRRHERHARAAAFVRSGRDRAWRLRPRRELRRAPGRALVEAVPRLRDRRASTRWSG